MKKEIKRSRLTKGGINPQSENTGRPDTLPPSSYKPQPALPEAMVIRAVLDETTCPHCSERHGLDVKITDFPPFPGCTSEDEEGRKLPCRCVAIKGPPPKPKPSPPQLVNCFGKPLGEPTPEWKINLICWGLAIMIGVFVVMVGLLS